MSLASPLLRRLVAVLALVVVTATLLGVPARSATAVDDSDLAEAAAAVDAAKADVQAKRAANQEALALRNRARDRVARRTDKLDRATQELTVAERALTRSRKRVAAARERLANAQSPRGRHKARRHLRVLRQRSTQRRLEAIAARGAHETAVDRLDRATATLAARQATLAGTRAVVAEARVVLATARQHYADLLELSTHQVVTAVANIPNRIGQAKFNSSMGALAANAPDFMVINEISGRSMAELRAAAPGYGVYRGGPRLTDPGAAGQSINNAVLWRSDGYQVVAKGRILVVDDDRGYHHKKRFLWDRYATWVTLRNVVDGQVTSVISTHMPTNPAKFPRQWGNPPLTRVQLYALGMDRITALAAQLATQGRVLVGGDMNSHPHQGSWAAVPKMAAAGYGFTKDRGVMYLFHSREATVPSSRQLAISSDHPALVTTVQYG